MKKVIFVAVVIIFLIPLASFSFEPSEEKDLTTEKRMMMRKGMMGKEKMHGKYSKMDMMAMMMKKSMVATSDGGVVVMAGNKLFKYDKNLNLIKEVEIEMDLEGIKKNMDEMKEKYHRSKQMMEEKNEAAAIEKAE